MKLTDMAIKKAKPQEKTYKLADGGGLFLQIEPKGGKLFRYAYRFAGKQKLLALGKYPDVSLQEARERHLEARKQLAHGIDPAAAKKAHKAAGVEKAANTFEVIAHEWLAVWKSDKVAGTIQRTESILKRDVIPYIGNRPITELKTPETLTVLRRIEDRGCEKMARKVKDVICMICRYAVQTGRCEYNACDNLRGALKPIQTTNRPALIKPDDVAELLRAIDTYHGTLPTVRAALRLAPLTFTRPGELREAKWEDFNLDEAVWNYTIRKTRNTGVSELIVPLSHQALEILRELHPLTGHGTYVFTGLRPGRPFSNMAINRALQTLGYDTKEEMTGHGFRAIARTVLDERLKWPAPIIEIQLAHKVKDPNGTAYNRTAFLDDRRTMMQTWADYLDSLKAGTPGIGIATCDEPLGQTM